MSSDLSVGQSGKINGTVFAYILRCFTNNRENLISISSLSAPNYAGAFSLPDNLDKKGDAADFSTNFAQILSQNLVTRSIPDEVRSTPAVTAAPSAADAKIAVFRSWKAEYFTKGISEDRRYDVEKYSGAFEQIIQKASTQGGYDDPQAFVASLSTDELSALQHIQCLANPIQPDQLSKEGALNLLYSPGSKQDINHDGVEEVGIGKSVQFPPPNAPDSVKQAWKDATAGMSEGDALTAQLMMIPVHIPINGGEAQFTYLGTDTDYSKLTQQVIAGLNFGKSYQTADQQANTDRLISGLQDFLGKLGNAA